MNEQKSRKRPSEQKTKEPTGSVHTSAKLIFHFSNKTEKGNITYPYHIYTFYSTDKNRKKENGQKN